MEKSMEASDNRGRSSGAKQPAVESVGSSMTDGKPSKKNVKKNMGGNTSTRLERKKQREQQRRREVNQGLEELQNILVQVDPALKADRERTKKMLQLDPKSVEADTSINRVDLIQRASNTIRRLSQENEQQKLLIQQLTMKVQSQSGTMALDQLGIGGTQTSIDAGSPAGIGGFQQQLVDGQRLQQQQKQQEHDQLLNSLKNDHSSISLLQQSLQQQQQQTLQNTRHAYASNRMPFSQNEDATLHAQLMQAQLQSARSHQLMTETIRLAATPDVTPRLDSSHVQSLATMLGAQQAAARQLQQQHHQEHGNSDEGDDGSCDHDLLFT